MRNAKQHIETRKSASSAIAFLATLSAVFSGDFVFAGFYIFFAFLLIIAAIRFSSKIRVVAPELLSFLALTLLFTFIMLANSIDLSSYYMALSFACIFVFSIRLIESLLERPEIAHYCGFVLLAMLPVAALALMRGDIRSSIMFGPNVYYRIIGYIYVTLLLVSMITGTSKKYRFAFLTVACAILLSTGSRGSLAIIFLLITIYAKTSIKFSPYSLLRMALSILFLIGVIIYSFDALRRRFSRLFYFDLENASLQTRWQFLSDARQYIQTFNLKEFFLGDGMSQRVFSYYPHNVLLEAFVYHGVIVLAIFLSFGALLAYSIFQPLDGRDRNTNLVLLFSPIFVGAMFSGSFFESYSVASVSTFVVMRLLCRKPRRHSFGARTDGSPRTSSRVFHYNAGSQ